MSQIHHCVICKTPFTSRCPDQTRVKFCSKRCQKKGQTTYDTALPTRVDKECLTCSKPFTCYRSQSMRKFCSRDCKKAYAATHGGAGFMDLTGQVFNRLTVISFAGKRYGTHNAWLCECSCPAHTRIVVPLHSLRRGRTQSCGCFGRGEGIPKPETKVCTKCGKEKPYTKEFFIAKGDFRWGLMPQCKACFQPVARINHAIYRRKLKSEVLSHCSNGTLSCVCCGERHIEFLTLDHINEDGKEDRKINGIGMIFYAKLKRRKYPPGFQTLCFNCNIAKSMFGECPHIKERSRPAEL